MAYMKRSPWIIHYDGSSCNGCDIEVLACLTPLYDVERFGVINTGNPKHADIFLVTGLGQRAEPRGDPEHLRQMPEPKVVVAVGICACSGGIFRECYNVEGGVDKVIPVDVYVPGLRRPAGTDHRRRREGPRRPRGEAGPDEGRRTGGGDA